MAEMDLFCVILFCVGTSVTLATLDHRAPIEEEHASSPLIQHLLERVDALERQDAKQASEIQSLRTEMSQQKGYMRQLRSKLHTKDKLIQILLCTVCKPINSEDLPTDGGMEDFDSMTEPVSDENDQRQQKRGQVKRIIPVENVPVAFSASFTHRQTHQANVDDNQAHTTIVFDNVETNIGNGYNVSSGVFTAPVSGIYVFSASVASLQNTAAHAFMILNKDKKACMFMKGVDEMAGQTMVLQVNKGDHVLIAVDKLESLYGHVYRSTSYTTFSGFLLHQTYYSTNGGPLFG